MALIPTDVVGADRPLPVTEIAVPLNARSASDRLADPSSVLPPLPAAAGPAGDLAADEIAADDPEDSVAAPPSTAADALARSRAMSWDEYHEAHPRSSMTEYGDDYSDGDDISVIEWWHEQSLVYRARNQRLVRPLVEEVIQPVITTLTDEQKRQEFVARHTLPDEIAPEVDVYDENARVVSMGAVERASAQSDESPESSRAVSRLQRRITDIEPTLTYAMRGIEEHQLPEDFYRQVESEDLAAQTGSPMVLQWAPTNFYHNPLYFEDPALERYGHTYHPLIQPFASTGRFATQLVGLPYQMALHPVHAHEYSLGWYRPGDCAPKLRYQIPFNEEAAVMQIAAVAGLLLIFP